MRSELDNKKVFGDSSSKKDTSKEDRKSLVQNFKSQVNEDIRFYDGSSMSSSRRPTQNAPRGNGFLSRYSKKQKLIGLAVIIAVIVIILAIVLAVTLSKSSSPDNPAPPAPKPKSINPYLLSKVELQDYGTQKYSFVRQDALQNSQGIPVTKDNSYLDTVEMTAQLVSYDILRLKIKDTNSDQFELPEDLLEADYNNDYMKGVRFNEFGFKIKNSTDNQTFGISITDIMNDHTYISSFGGSFLMMSHYQEFSFEIHSDRLYGLGERVAKFILNSGSYTLFPYASQDPKFDTGETPGNELQGQHPFLMARLQSGKFVGIFLFNSSPQTFVIDKLGNGNSIVKIITTGGVMDLFFFKGPRYDDVVRQYQRLIGKPKMLPLWAHGIQIRNKLYSDKETLYDHVKELIQYDINVEMVILPLEAMKDMVNFKFDIDTQDFKKTFPDTKLAYPYTYFVPNIDETKEIIKEMILKNMAVSVNDLALQVKLSDLQGYCIDFFHPDILTLLTLIQSTFDFNHTALFLDNNTPYFPSTSAEPPTTNPFSEIPYIPGMEERGPLDKATLPPYSEHIVDTNPTKPRKEYHFNLHSLYGSKMAQILAKNMPKDSKAYVISDATFPGAGKYGIGHLLPQENFTYESLKVDISNMLNFNMFGIPYSSPNLCGYEVTDDMELCIRSMQLSCVNPLAIINQDKIPVFPNYLNYSGSLQSVFGQRLRYMIYQRTELYKVQKYGGTLLKPLISLFPNDTRFDEDTFAYGESFKVEFITQQGVKEITRYFPEGKWYHVDERTLLYNMTAGIDYGFYATIKARLAEIEMFQKFGTIIAYQDARATKTENLSYLVNYPLLISIVVDSFDKHSAIGNILIENGEQSEYYEINMEYGIISFKQQNDGQIPFDLHKTIKKIQITDVHEDIYFACALMNDFQTVKELNAQTLRSSNYRFTTLTPKTLDSHQLDPLQIDELAFIFYSANDTAKCNADTFNIQILGEPKIFSETTFYAQLRQNMYYIMDFDNKFYDIYLNITLLSDNSLYMFWSASNYHPYTSAPTDIYDRNFTQFQNLTKSIKLEDILTVNNNPFYIEIHEPGKPENILFTTKDQIHFFYQQFTIFNYQQPNANPDRFFGIQERKGKFFLQDNYMYSLFNNDNNLEDRHIGNGRVIQHGRSGSHPVVFSQGLNTDKLTSVTNFIPYGVDIIYRKQLNNTKASPQITQIAALSLLEFVFTFGLTPLETSKAVHSVINFGNFLKLEKPYFAPYYTMNGWYANSDGLGDAQGLLDQKKEYERNFYPLEGFNFNMHFLDNFDSLILNKDKIKDQNEFLQETVGKGQSLISVVKSGFNEREFKEDYPVIQRGDMPYPDDKQDPVTGLDQSGKVYYLDYSAQKTQDIMKEKLENYLQGFHESHKIINLKYNQIFEVYSNEDVNERVRVKQENRLLYRIGTSDQMMNTIAHSALREMGDDSKLHNLNPFLQAATIKNISERYNIYSDASCLGIGQMGIGRLLHYYSSSTQDLHLAIEQLQSLSILGMHNVGLSLTTDTSLDPADIDFQTKLLSMIPLATEKLITHDTLPNAFQDQKRLRKLKYYTLPYMQTHLFIAQNSGLPLLRPLFYEYPQNQDVYGMINKQYFYGPYLKVNIQKNVNEQEPITYFFKGFWCQIADTEYESDCFYQDEDGFAEQENAQDFIYMKGGSILPLSGATLDKTINYIANVQDMTRKVDLHIVPDYKGTGQAYGEYVGQSEYRVKTTVEYKGLCVLGFTYAEDKIDIKLITNDFYPGEMMCTEEPNRGGDIVIYSTEALKYTKAEYIDVIGRVMSTYDIEKLKLAPAYRIVNSNGHSFSTVDYIKLI